jgi:ribosome-binding factor A
MSIRAEKVSSVIKRALAEPISRIVSENSAGLVTITSVRMSNDLQVAKVFLSIYGGKVSPGKFLPLVEEKAGMLRSHIGKAIKLRFTPELRFFLDDTLEQMERIQNLINTAKKADENLPSHSNDE